MLNANVRFRCFDGPARNFVNDAIERPVVRSHERREQHDLVERRGCARQCVAEQPLHRDRAARALTEQMTRRRQVRFERAETRIERRDVVVERFDRCRFAGRQAVTRQIEREHGQAAVEQKTDQVAIEPDVIVVAVNDDRAALGIARRPQCAAIVCVAVSIRPSWCARPSIDSAK